MINIVGDTHTHTVACDHAYSTITENAARAKELGHRFLCLTEHAPALPGGASKVHFGTLPSILPTEINGIEIIKGAELNILDYDGAVDLPDEIISQLEWVIASYHPPCLAPATVAEHTRGWIKIAKNPLIRVIGHCDRAGYEFELVPVLEAFKACGKVLELNAHSMRRGQSIDNCREIAALCAQVGVPIVLSSDAHINLKVGAVEDVVEMLEEIGFPEELVLNANYDRFMRALGRID
ncbi:MAG: phosphatase [Oscillospiraceae bacterium]|nr:phosphatase [Oscillospiraceae bacterium]